MHIRLSNEKITCIASPIQHRDSNTGHSGSSNSRSRNSSGSSCWVAAGIASLTAEEKEKLFFKLASMRLDDYLLDLPLAQYIDAR